MLFNSYEFVLIFLPITLISYYLGVLFKRPILSRLTLLLSSLVFYAYWDIRYLPLLILSMTANFLIGQRIVLEPSTKTFYLTLGIVLNLALLFYFKYFSFTLGILQALTGLNLEGPAITLPLGISFFTFTQIAFLVDAYQHRVETLTPVSYGLFVTVFPHLIAGPILHHKEMMNQFQDNHTYRWNADNSSKGLLLFVIGMAKKVLIADRLAPLVASVFDVPGLQAPLFDAWGAAIAYTLQLYFDFSGYSDMAVGLGLLFNIQLPINFNSPYKATSIIDFWKRWHMTLSAFLREYLYIPLGGNRKGETHKLACLFLTMLLGGLWHGAGWTFVLWGALQGLYLVLNHVAKKRLFFPTAISWPLTLVAVIIGWVIFRSSDIQQAMMMFKGMVGLHGIRATVVASSRLISTWQLGSLVLLLAAVLLLPNSNQWADRLKPRYTEGFIAGLILTVCILHFGRISQFLYFQF